MSEPRTILTPTPQDPSVRRTYLLVDGENIDATLGMSVLSRRPAPEERPRWDRIAAFAAQLWDQPVTPLFYLNATSGQMPMPFVQALLAMGYKPIPVAAEGNEKVVDVAIQRTLDAIVGRDADVLLASHDGDFLPQVEKLVGGDRRVGVICFREFVNSQFAALADDGLEFFDLEGDIGAFQVPLPRVRIIPISEFDPSLYL